MDLLFKLFGSINHWSIPAIGLQGIVALVYGIGFTFASGTGALPEYVHQGPLINSAFSPQSLCTIDQ
jgi:hypothetical protein